MIIWKTKVHKQSSKCTRVQEIIRERAKERKKKKEHCFVEDAANTDLELS